MELLHRLKWKEGFQFALARGFRTKEGLPASYPMSIGEKFGSIFLTPLYKTFEQISKYIRKPIAISLFTLIAALLAVVVFYNFPAFVILGKLFPYQTVRFILFLYIESILLCIGCRALGRFNNSVLIELWREDKLIPILPGERI